MSCILRAFGKEFDVDRFLSVVPISPVVEVWHRGDPQLPGTSTKTSTAGFNVEFSNADWDDLEGQIRDVVHALKVWEDSLRTLVSWPGVEDVFCDFGTRRRGEALMQAVYFPADLIHLAGGLKIGLKLSIYSMQEGTGV